MTWRMHRERLIFDLYGPLQNGNYNYYKTKRLLKKCVQRSKVQLKRPDHVFWHDVWCDVCAYIEPDIAADSFRDLLMTYVYKIMQCHDAAGSLATKTVVTLRQIVRKFLEFNYYHSRLVNILRPEDREACNLLG